MYQQSEWFRQYGPNKERISTSGNVVKDLLSPNVRVVLSTVSCKKINYQVYIGKLKPTKQLDIFLRCKNRYVGPYAYHDMF